MGANGDGSKDNGLHIVMFPWFGFGHMLPYLGLSRALARRGHRISFISTPRNIQRLPKPPPEISHLVDLIPFDLPKVEGLREGAEATSDVPNDEVPYLKKALDGLERPFDEFIKQAHPKPDWIVHDYQHHWVPAVGAAHGIPCIFFIITTAAFQVYYNPPPELVSLPPDGSLPPLEKLVATPPWIPFPSKLACRRHEIVKVLKQLALPSPLRESAPDGCKMVIEGSTAVAIRSCNEVESRYLSLASRLMKRPVLPVGLLPPSVSERDEQASEAEVAMMKWLSQRSSRSVVYVSLGSECRLDIDMLHQLALGLEAAKVPFFWALKRPSGLGDDVDLLPEGFEDRTAGLGMVVMSWVPQVRILAHDSVGGFLTHCGWGSIIEALLFGRPLVLLPLDHDQALNSRLAAEEEMGVEVERDDEDGSFTREDVAKAVRLVVADDDGEVYRQKALKLMEFIASKECRDKPVDDFVEFLRGHRLK